MSRVVPQDAPPSDLAAHAVELLEHNAYLTLGTAGADGLPWTTPVYFAADGLRDYYWCSNPDSLHSRHVDERPDISLVVFDSTVRPYHGRALYARAAAEMLDGDELEVALSVYPGPPQRGGREFRSEELSGASPLRLYRARAAEVWVLCPRAPRMPCPLHGRSDDHRARVVPPA
jgi:nitroimidazol reductase NimA-like FMN-containing flavoprotein (pyridoxamine 5'-phosphate oxidase superfamily)